MTLRARLTLLVVCVLVATMSAFAWVLVKTTRTQFTNQIGQRLIAAAARDRPGVRPSAGSDFLPGPFPQPEAQHADVAAVSKVDPGGRQTATLLFGADGVRRIADPSGFQNKPDPLPQIPRIGSPEHLQMIDRLTTLPSVDGSMRYLVMARRVRAGDYRFDAGSLSGVDAAIASLTRKALFGGTAAVLLASLVSIAIMRRNFRPVDRMVATAAAIASGDLSARVADDSQRTEIGRLGGSINTMLATIEAAIGERDDKEQELRQFVADASHELRTPLTAVLGYSDLFLSGALHDPDDLRRAMTRLGGQATRMSRLVDDLLLLANLDRVDFLRPAPSNVAAIARDAAADFSTTSPDHSLTIDVPEYVIADVDPDRFRQVIDNLLTNVRVHTEAGTDARLSLTQSTHAFCVRVADTGAGIAPDDREKLFARFWRADSSRARRTGGSGLGLAITASIVAAHHGRINVEPNTPRGTEFVVTIPLAGLAV